jgi:hypothetical protein
MERSGLVNRLTRRGFIGGTGAAFGLVAAPGVMRTAKAQSWQGGNPLSLGINSRRHERRRRDAAL